MNPVPQTPHSHAVYIMKLRVPSTRPYPSRSRFLARLSRQAESPFTIGESGASGWHVEVLESRIAPAAVLDILAGENVSFTGDGASDNTTVSDVGGTHVGFTNSGGLSTVEVVDGVNIIQVSANEIRVNYTLIDGGTLTMTGGGGTDDILINSGVPAFTGLSLDYETVQALPALTIGSGGLSVNASTGGITVSGAIAVTGASATLTAAGSMAVDANITAAGVSLTGAGITLGAFAINGGSQPVALDGQTGTVSLSGAVTTTSSVSITADNVAIGASVTGPTGITIQPDTLTQTIQLNNAGAGLNLTSAELDLLSAASGAVTIGASGGTGAVSIGGSGALALGGGATDYNLTLRGGAVTFTNGITLSSSRTFTFNTGAITGSGATDVTSTSGTLALNTTGAVTMLADVSNFGASTLSGGAVNVSNPTSLTVTGAVTAASAFTLTTTGANTDITVSGGAITGTGADISLNATRQIIISQDVTTNGTGSITLSGNTGTGARNITIDATRTVSTVNGSLTLDADRGVGIAGIFSGVSVAGTVSVTGTGTLSVAGRGGNTSGANAGVIVQSGGDLIGGTTGTMTVSGIGGANGLTGNYGVRVTGSGSTITSGGANVQVTGTAGGTGASSGNHGVSLNAAGAITAGGAGTVTVQGTGGAGTGGSNAGVFVGTTSATITSNGGAVNVTGIAGAGTSTAIDLSDATASITTATSGGAMTLIGDSMSIVGTVSANGSSTVTLRQNTNGNTITLGAADSAGVLGLTDAELDQVSGGTIAIGNTNTGSITIGSAALTQGAKTFVFTTGGGITIGANSFTTTGNVTLTADSDANGTGAITTGAGVVGAGTLTVSAAAGIALNTTATTLSAVNSTSGNISITESNSVDIAALTTLAGNGSITFATTSGSITTSGAINAHGAGTISLTAGGGGEFAHGRRGSEQHLGSDRAECRFDGAERRGKLDLQQRRTLNCTGHGFDLHRPRDRRRWNARPHRHRARDTRQWLLGHHDRCKRGQSHDRDRQQRHAHFQRSHHHPQRHGRRQHHARGGHSPRRRGRCQHHAHQRGRSDAE